MTLGSHVVVRPLRGLPYAVQAVYFRTGRVRQWIRRWIHVQHEGKTSRRARRRDDAGGDRVMYDVASCSFFGTLFVALAIETSFPSFFALASSIPEGMGPPIKEVPLEIGSGLRSQKIHELLRIQFADRGMIQELVWIHFRTVASPRAAAAAWPLPERLIGSMVTRRSNVVNLGAAPLATTAAAAEEEEEEVFSGRARAREGGLDEEEGEEEEEEGEEEEGEVEGTKW
eukprot:CAMPEP_0175051366 /NCGR_PEP_ID=MMETSP0052_2-20121109/7755_1 /TAXON_ID=51329 ORGANISM="Polytomella parva, Strain SAG 63-3" /NCGR_SAMPLE_ID=MMETSP0052_2 /ASSEMBLY_ACC=CAM_ASM_000194 /LENGTH=227 /DNA_ID=CAMNT_0016315633 /DNA_START=42 /DNA_END=723 /DNA_ORIENTATION=-